MSRQGRLRELCCQFADQHQLWMIRIDSRRRKVRLTQKEGDLPSNPMPAPINTQTPNNQSQTAQHGSGISKPEPHLGVLLTPVLLCKTNHQPIALSTREEKFANNRTENKSEEEQTLHDQRVICVGCRHHGDE